VLGRARGLADVVHTLWSYDVEIDTGSTPTERSVESVLGALRRRSRSA